MAKPSEAPLLRRSARVHIQIPVTISGTLADGKPFTEETQIITVSKFGAKLKTQQPLHLGMRLSVQPKRRRNKGLFRVVWVGRPGTPRQGEVGIEYVEVSNLLGVAFPE